MIKTRGNRLLRFLDRYGGITLISLLALVSRKKKLPSSIRTIGILKLAGIGDLIVLSGVIQDIHKHYPEAQIVLFCGKESGAIAPYIPGLAAIEYISVTRFFAAVNLFRKYSLDLLLDFEQWSHIDVLLTKFSGARFTAGFQTQGQARHFLFDKSIPHLYEMHEIDNFRALAKSAHIISTSAPQLHFPSIETDIKKPYILFHPWTVSLVKGLKEWPVEYWTKLGHYFKEQGYEVYITGGKNDRADSEALATSFNGVSLAGKTSFPVLVDYIKKARCLISVDTGVMHLAASLDTPLIALFGPTSPHRWGPLSSQASTISGGTPYMYLGFEKPSQPEDCMRKILPEEVISTFKSKIVDS